MKDFALRSQQRKSRMFIALEMGLTKALQMLTLARWVVDTRVHAEKKTGVQRPPERH